MAHQNKAIIDRFWSTYKATFGQVPIDREDDVEVYQWTRMIEKIPFRRLDELFEAVIKKRGNARWRPMVEDFKRAFVAMTGEATGMGRHPGCEFCGFSGHFAVIAHIGEHGDRKLGLGEGAALYKVPCKCGKGRRYAKGDDENVDLCMGWKVSMQDEMAKSELPSWMNYEAYLDKLVRERRAVDAKRARKVHLSKLRREVEQERGDELQRVGDSVPDLQEPQAWNPPDRNADRSVLRQVREEDLPGGADNPLGPWVNERSPDGLMEGK